MNKTVVESTLTVFFAEPFWIGIYERITNGRYEVCKITFGAEPSSQEIWQYLLDNWSMLNFSQSEMLERKPLECKNPKRQQRIIKKQLKNMAVGTRAQQALKQQYEQRKTEVRTEQKLDKQAEKDRQYKLHKEKQRMRHRGK